MAAGIVRIIEKTCNKMCDSYCKYPLMDPPEGKNEDWLYEDDSPCCNCPLNNLLYNQETPKPEAESVITLHKFIFQCGEMAKENWPPYQIDMLQRLFGAVIKGCKYDEWELDKKMKSGRLKSYQPQLMNERLKEAINQSGLNCVEIGKRVGLERKSIYAYRDGDTYPNAMILAKLCVVLNVSADYLLFGKE